MTNPSLAIRRLSDFRARHPDAVYLLAMHASLAAAVNAEFLHHLRDNFLLDGPVTDRLSITPTGEAEMARLLLSPLFVEVGDGLYEMDREMRVLLVSELAQLGGGQRMKEVATLLDQYTREESPWAEWPELVNAQLVSAFGALDPQLADEFLEGGIEQGNNIGVDDRWFAVMRQRIAQDRATAAAVEELRTPTAAPEPQESARPEVAIPLRDMEQVVLIIETAELRAMAVRVTSFGLLVTSAHAIATQGPRFTTRPIRAGPRRVATPIASDRARDVGILMEDVGNRAQTCAVLAHDVPVVGARATSISATDISVGTIRFVGAVQSHDQLGSRIQAGISLAPGSSGCGLFDESGQLVGIGATRGREGRRSTFVPVEEIIETLASVDASDVTRSVRSNVLSDRDVDLLFRVAGRAASNGNIATAAGWLGLALRGAQLGSSIGMVAERAAELIKSTDDPGRALTLLADAVESAVALNQSARGPVLRDLMDTIQNVIGTERAQELGRESAALDEADVPESLRALGRRFDEASRTPDNPGLTEILDQVRAESPLVELLPQLTGSASPGLRFVAIVMLQAQPLEVYLDWLADRSSRTGDGAFAMYHAAVALRNAAESLPKENLDRAKHAVGRASRTAGASALQDRATVLDVAAEIIRRRQRTPDVTPAREVPTAWSLWDPGTTLRVRFLDGTARQRAVVARLAPRWVTDANLDFEFLPSGSRARAQLRVSFGTSTWSYLGTDANSVQQGQPTMSIDGGLAANSPEFRREVLRCFGFALGLINEFQSPRATIGWDVETLYKTFTGPPNHWTREQIDQQFLVRYSMHDPEYRAFDPKSVMLREIPPELVHGERIGGATTLSESDRSFVATLYGPRTTPQPQRRSRPATPSIPTRFRTMVVTGGPDSRDADELRSLIAKFSTFVTKAGLPDDKRTPEITILDDGASPNASYERPSGGAPLLKFHPEVVKDDSIVMRSYAHHLLVDEQVWDTVDRRLLAVESALADYFPASMLDDPVLGRVAARVLPTSKGWTRNLGNTRRMPSSLGNRSPEDLGEVWSGAMWEIRSMLGRETADGRLAIAWRTTKPAPSATYSQRFIDALLSGLPATDRRRAREVFSRRNLLVSPTRLGAVKRQSKKK